MSGMIQPQFRIARQTDFEALDSLFHRAYPVLLKPDYAPSVMVTAVPLIAKAQPHLLSSGTYFVADLNGQLVAAGGWTRAAPGAGGAVSVAEGHVRHVVTDPDHVRQGMGRGVMQRAMAQARAHAIRQLHCFSTFTAVAFYESLGFRALGEVEVPLRAGIVFPAVKMHADL